MKEAFNGEILEIPGIAVDNFSKEGIRAYFLSHCHADHIGGLNKLTDLPENVFIYMSEISAAIVECYINEDIKKSIKPLKLETTTITIPGDENADVPETYVEVTLIPAGHCFGSVMFLFETPLKKVLFTGDFRISENSVSKMAQLHQNNKPVKLDTLYVDTTFLDKEYEYFPKRSEILDGLFKEIQTWLDKGKQYCVALKPSARYGYEDIFNKLYNKIGIKVYVDSNWTLYSKFLDRLPGVTNNSNEKRIHLCSKNKNYCTCRYDDDSKYLSINFSAMKWRRKKSDDLYVVKNDCTVDVCFSTHCSRSELVYFIGYLSPKNVVGFPNPYVSEEVPKVTSKRPRNLDKDAQNKKAKKVPKHVLKYLFE